MDDLRKRCPVIHLFDPKYQNLFQYDASLESYNHLFRYCQFMNVNNKREQICADDTNTVLNKKQFIHNLNEHFHFFKWCNNIDWSVYNISGGCLLKCILSHSLESTSKQDIDLFCSIDGNAETVAQNKQHVDEFTRQMIQNGYPVTIQSRRGARKKK
eukprot:846028_1